MKLKLFVIILFLITGCNENTPQTLEKSVHGKENQIQRLNSTIQEIDYDELEIVLKKNSISYSSLKQKIKRKLNEPNFKNLSIDSLSYYFTENLLNQIIPYWYGTTWSFTGHTSKPGEGEIACGYFVSTTLKDMGININRYKLAQQNPINEARSLNIDKEVVEISKATTKENIKALKEYLEEGIYFIGFDQSHVGYVLKRKNQLFLIHSNYINSEGVIIEPIEKSEVFSSFQRFYFAEISTNKTLLERWISNKKIQVITKEK